MKASATFFKRRSIQLSVFEFTTTESPTMVNLIQYLSYLTIKRAPNLKWKWSDTTPTIKRSRLNLKIVIFKFRDFT